MKKLISILAVALVALSLFNVTALGQGLLNRNARTARNNTARNNTAATRSTPATTPATTPAAGSSSFNWDNESEDGIFQMYSDLVKKTILRHPDCPKATITLKTRPGQVLSKEEQIEAIEVVLEMHGIHLEPYGDNFIRAIPRKDARKEGIPIITNAEQELGERGRVVSMMIPFRNIAIDEAQKALEGLKSNSGILLVFERTNSILVTDTEQNIKRMLEIAHTLDIATPVLENVFVRQIKYASADEIKTALEAIVQDSQKEQEKNNKAVNNNQAQRQFNQSSNPFNRLRPGQKQPEQPVNNQSLVMEVSDADRGMIRGKTLILSDQRSNKLIIVTMKTNMDFFDKVIEQLDVETTPDTVVKVYRLKYADSEDVSDMINDLIGNASSSKSSSKSSQNQASKAGAGANLSRSSTPAAKKSVNQRTGDAKAGELSKENTTVLSDKRINGLVVMTNKELVPVVEQIIESMDVKLSQVLIETCIIEVTLGDDLKTGIDWVRNGRQSTTGQATDPWGNKLYYINRTTTDAEGNSTTERVLQPVLEDYEKSYTSGESTITETADLTSWPIVSQLTKDNFWNGSDSYASMLGGGSSYGAAASAVVDGTATNIFGSALNYVFKSDSLNLSAIIQATKTDSRTKYIASPVVMTVDNKEATIEATTARKFLTNYQTSSSYYGSTPAPQYESKDIGIKIKVTPKINPNGTVMLEVEEEYSQVGAKQSILDPNSKPVDIDTSLTRKMSADALLENNQTVILCGLTETQTSSSETGIPILKDIPYIGKWLFGKVEQTEARSELIIFMTPYVLNDGEEAQAEALRRKKALSDSRPWDDHGWSKSPLADPVSKKEQLRRLKDDWKNQDEEYKTRMEVEKEKLKRAKSIRELNEDEKKLWLEIHKSDLKSEEAKKEFEKKLEDESEQEGLKQLAAQVRARKLAESEKQIKAMEQATETDNEYNRLKDIESKKNDESRQADESKQADADKKGK